MKHIFWLEKNRIAGRTGPNTDPWDPAELKGAGITAVISVNDGLLCHPGDFEALGMAYRCMPLADNSPPLPGDLEFCVEALPRAYDFVAAQIEQNGTVLIHCTSGKDRTGLLMAYILMRRWRMPAKDAMAAVKKVRDIAFSAEGWQQFTYDVLSSLSPTNDLSDIN